MENNKITIVQGYHYGFKLKPRRHAYIDTNKTYNFRVTNRTHNVKSMKKYRTCSVLTKQGKAQLVITKIIYPTGSIAVKYAKKQKPVINFRNYGMTIQFLYHLLKKNTNCRITSAQVRHLVKLSRRIVNNKKKSHYHFKKHTKK